TGVAADRRHGEDRAADRVGDRPLRAARLLPVPLPAVRGRPGEGAVPGKARGVRGEVPAGAGAEVAAGVPDAVLRQPVQAELPAGWAEGRLGEPLAARRLADAVRRGRRGVARRAGRVTAPPAGAHLEDRSKSLVFDPDVSSAVS